MVDTLPTQTNADPDGWNPPMPPTDLIFDDGEPLETNQHRVAVNVLIRSYQQYRTGQTDFYVGGNMFIYYSSTQVKNRDFRGPDFFVVLDVEGTRDRQGWVVWEEEGRYPDVIIELMSPSTAKVDLGLKKQLYGSCSRRVDSVIMKECSSSQDESDGSRTRSLPQLWQRRCRQTWSVASRETAL